MKRFKLVLMLMMSLVMMKSLDAQSIRVLPVPESNITNVAAEMLYDRLNQVVALNGVSSVDNSNKFLLVPKVTVLSIEPTPMFPRSSWTAPTGSAPSVPKAAPDVRPSL